MWLYTVTWMPKVGSTALLPDDVDDSNNAISFDFIDGADAYSDNGTIVTATIKYLSILAFPS